MAALVAHKKGKRIHVFAIAMSRWEKLIEDDFEVAKKNVKCPICKADFRPVYIGEVSSYSLTTDATKPGILLMV